MEASLEMSLDDLIAKNKSARRENRPRGARSGAGGAVRTGRRGGARTNGAPYAAAAVPAASSIGATKIQISNLNHNVVQKDILELFSTVGPVKSAVLNHDDKGRSKGSATVIFKRNGDANKAYEEFHDRTLDGRPMRIELLVNPASLVAAPSARVPAAAPAAAPNGSRRGGRGGRGGRRGRFIRGGRGGSKQTPKTADELDAEMDSYMKDEVMGEAAA